MYTYIYIYICMCIHMYTCVYVYVYMYIHVYIYIYIYVYIYTHTHVYYTHMCHIYYICTAYTYYYDCYCYYSRIRLYAHIPERPNRGDQEAGAEAEHDAGPPRLGLVGRPLSLVQLCVFALRSAILSVSISICLLRV